MSRFMVTWGNDALQELARVWLDSRGRAAIDAAAMRIDAELSRDPHLKGEEVAEGLRRVDISPLRAYFVISDDDRKVDVVGVGDISK
jgi:hypothetical protein